LGTICLASEHEAVVGPGVWVFRIRVQSSGF
jgi:hypothetical protein